MARFDEMTLRNVRVPAAPVEPRAPVLYFYYATTLLYMVYRLLSLRENSCTLLRRRRRSARLRESAALYYAYFAFALWAGRISAMAT